MMHSQSLSVKNLPVPFKGSLKPHAGHSRNSVEALTRRLESLSQSLVIINFPVHCQNALLLFIVKGLRAVLNIHDRQTLMRDDVLPFSSHITTSHHIASHQCHHAWAQIRAHLIAEQQHGTAAATSEKHKKESGLLKQAWEMKHEDVYH